MISKEPCVLIKALFVFKIIGPAAKTADTTKDVKLKSGVTVAGNEFLKPDSQKAITDFFPQMQSEGMNLNLFPITL